MTSGRLAAVCFGLACVTGLCFTVSRAEEKQVAPADSVVALVARIESLEKRIAVLEEKEKAARQVNAIVVPPNPCPTPRPVPEQQPPQEAARPKGRILLLKQSETIRQ